MLIPILNGMTIFGHTIGWRGAFLATGLFDLCWIIGWLTIYRKPAEHSRVSPEELAYINSEPPEPSIKVPWGRLFQFRQAWAFVVGKFMTDCFWWFYLFVLPIFFKEQFHLDPKARLWPIAIIYLLSSVGSIAGGWLAGHFMKIGWSTNKARKTTMLICALAILPVFYAAVSANAWVAVALIAVAAAAHQAWSANLFSLSSDMFPRRVVASVTGLGGMVGSVGGIVMTAVTAVIKDHGGSYFYIFLAASFAYILALGLIHLLVPRMEVAQVDLPAAVKS
jgi:ACS family hexuronate transporter-like MFS transporter